MELKLKNKTADPQQIMFCNGEALTVSPGDEKTIDLGSIFTEELKRLGSFFDVEEKILVKNEYVRPTKIATVVSNKDEGGNE